MVAADQRAGYPSRGVYRDSPNARYAVGRDAGSNIIIDPPGTRWDDVHWLFLEDLLRRGDIFVAYFECLFFHTNQKTANESAFRLLRTLGVRIIVCAHGGDVVHRIPMITRYDWVGREQRDYPQWDLVEQIPTAKERIRLFCKLADLVLPLDSAMARFLPRNDLLFKFWPIDCDEICPAAGPTNARPVIIHAPNHRFTKGTEFLLAAAERLREKGFEFELRLVEKVPRHEALKIYQQADIIADQFCMGVFGAFACEAMAMGKPVLAYLDNEMLGNPVFNCPLVNTTPENLEAVLAILLRLPELRRRLGEAGRRAMEMYQSIEAMAEVWDRIYRAVWWGEPLALEGTRHFSREREPRAFTEDPARADFWPVLVEDLLPGIHGALRQAGLPVNAPADAPEPLTSTGRGVGAR